MKRIICSILTILICLCVNISSTLAFDLDTNIDAQMLKQNQIEISLKLSDLNEYTNGINIVTGKLIYDSDIFEEASFTGVNNWSCAYNDEEGNESKGKFILMTTSGNATEDIEIAKIKLKLKQDINSVKTKIILQEIQTSYQSKKIKTEDIEFKFIINNDLIEVFQNENQSEYIETKENIEVQDSISSNNDTIEKNYNIIIYVFSIILVIILITILALIIKIKIKRSEKNEK